MKNIYPLRLDNPVLMIKAIKKEWSKTKWHKADIIEILGIIKNKWGFYNVCVSVKYDHTVCDADDYIHNVIFPYPYKDYESLPYDNHQKQIEWFNKEEYDILMKEVCKNDYFVKLGYYYDTDNV